MFLLIVSTNHFKVYIKNKHLSGNYSISKYLEIWESDRSNFAKYWIFIQEKLLLYCIFAVITRLLITVRAACSSFATFSYVSTQTFVS